MTEIPVDKTPGAGGPSKAEVVDVEREVTKRRLIESVTTVVLVVLYMIFSLVRDRDPGVVALDGAGDDWKA